MGSIGDNQLAALSGYTGTIQDRIRKALVNPPTDTGTIDDLGGYLGRTTFWSSPADESSLVGWYQPSGINVTGTDITQWDDDSGEGNHLTVSNGGVYPQNTGNINGVTCGSFSPSGSLGVVAAYSQPMSIFFAARDDNFTNTRHLFSAYSIPPLSRFSGGYDTSSWVLNFGSRLDIPYTRDNNVHIFSFVINGANSAFYEDGVLIGSGNVGTLDFERLTIGGIVSTYTCWQGDIAEAIFLNKAMDATSHNRNGEYLANLYGTTWNAVS